MDGKIVFRCDGVPQTKGSAKAFMRRGARYPTVTNDNAKCKPWQAALTLAAAQAMSRAARIEPTRGPVALTLKFCVPRPGGHYGSGKNAEKLRPSAPQYPTVKPDLDKLVRAVKDGLTGVVYGDDSQVIKIDAVKLYATHIHPCGVVVQVDSM